MTFSGVWQEFDHCRHSGFETLQRPQEQSGLFPAYAYRDNYSCLYEHVENVPLATTAVPVTWPLLKMSPLSGTTSEVCYGSTTLS